MVQYIETLVMSKMYLIFTLLHVLHQKQFNYARFVQALFQLCQKYDIVMVLTFCVILLLCHVFYKVNVIYPKFMTQITQYCCHIFTMQIYVQIFHHDMHVRSHCCLLQCVVGQAGVRGRSSRFSMSKTSTERGIIKKFLQFMQIIDHVVVIHVMEVYTE